MPIVLLWVFLYKKMSELQELIKREIWAIKEDASQVVAGAPDNDSLDDLINPDEIRDGGYAGWALDPHSELEGDDLDDITERITDNIINKKKMNLPIGSIFSLDTIDESMFGYKNADDSLIKQAVDFIERLPTMGPVSPHNNNKDLLQKFLIASQNIKKALQFTPNDINFFNKLISLQNHLKQTKTLNEDLVYWHADDAGPDSDSYELVSEDGTSLYTTAQGTVDGGDVPWDLQEGMNTKEIADLVVERITTFMPKAKGVKVKKKCQLGGKGDGTSEACDQGDINALEFGDINDSNRNRRDVNWVNVATENVDDRYYMQEGIITRKKDDEIFNYNDAKESAWKEPIEHGQKFYGVNFDLENNESSGQKKTFYFTKNLRKDQPVKYEINADLCIAGGDWQHPVMYFKIELTHDYSLKGSEHYDKKEFPWDSDDYYGKRYVMIPPVEAGNKFTKCESCDNYDYIAWDDDMAYEKGIEDEELKISDLDKKNAWNWLKKQIEDAIDDRHKMLDESKNTKKSLLKEEKVKFGALMLYFDIPKWKSILSNIRNEDLYDDGSGTFGKEHEPHTTILYGFHDDVTPEQMREAIGDSKPFTVEAKNIGIFQNEKFDVVKINIKPSPELLELRKKVETLPNTLTYKDYKPHMTLAYVKSGEGNKYLKEFENAITLKPEKLIFSDKDRKHTEFTIENGKKE